MFIRSVVWLVSVLIVCAFVLQVLIPLWRGAPLFPYFRRKKSPANAGPRPPHKENP
jgi:hypothetical protein